MKAAAVGFVIGLALAWGAAWFGLDTWVLGR